MRPVQRALDAEALIGGSSSEFPSRYLSARLDLARERSNRPQWLLCSSPWWCGARWSRQDIAAGKGQGHRARSETDCAEETEEWNTPATGGSRALSQSRCRIGWFAPGHRAQDISALGPVLCLLLLLPLPLFLSHLGSARQGRKRCSLWQGSNRWFGAPSHEERKEDAHGDIRRRYRHVDGERHS